MSDAFETDLIAHLAVLRRFALSLCRRGDQADDLVQITIERAWTSRARFDPETRMQAWLFRILRNAWIDQGRRLRTRGTEVEIGDHPEALVTDGPRATDARLMLDATERAIDRLPPEQRELILLVCYEELTYAEAAGVLGLPVGTVMSRLARGRLALAKDLGIGA